MAPKPRSQSGLLLLRQMAGFYSAVDSKVLCFVKVYREILYNRDKTDYIPNFDNFTLADKIRTIALLTGRSAKEISGLDRDEIDETYFGLIKRQVARLERETVDFGNGYY